MQKGDVIWLAFFLGISAFLVVPSTQQIVMNASQAHAYLMGFIKFAVLATMGELLAWRITAGKWIHPPGLIYKAVVWGFLGMCIVLIFTIFVGGVASAVKAHLLFIGKSAASAFLNAFYVSAIMNLTFAPAMMIFHRFTDTYIDLRREQTPTERSRNRLTTVIHHIDWEGFFKFVIFKTIPLFWIPAHTITFLLPAQYQVLFAAYLSVALGTILAYAKKRQTAGISQSELSNE